MFIVTWIKFILIFHVFLYIVYFLDFVLRTCRDAIFLFLFLPDYTLTILWQDWLIFFAVLPAVITSVVFHLWSHWVAIQAPHVDCMFACSFRWACEVSFCFWLSRLFIAIPISVWCPWVQFALISAHCLWMVSIWVYFTWTLIFGLIFVIRDNSNESFLIFITWVARSLWMRKRIRIKELRKKFFPVRLFTALVFKRISKFKYKLHSLYLASKLFSQVINYSRK